MIINYKLFNLLTEGWLSTLVKKELTDEERNQYDELNKKLGIFYRAVSYDKNFKKEFTIFIPKEVSHSGGDESGKFNFRNVNNKEKGLHTINSNLLDIYYEDNKLGVLDISNGNYRVIDGKSKEGNLIDEFFTKIKKEPKKAIFMDIKSGDN